MLTREQRGVLDVLWLDAPAVRGDTFVTFRRICFEQRVVVSCNLIPPSPALTLCTLACMFVFTSLRMSFLGPPFCINMNEM